MAKKLILIVGLQKSGTSLLFRMVQGSGHAENPFRGEGLDLWGDVPPFSPHEFPTGEIYQRHGGEAGHEAGAEDATPDVKDVLRKRFDSLEGQATVFANKNPYNTVRLPWLRAIFPESTIVGIVRRPVANVYSLLKKYEPHGGRGQPPGEGWWGVKPRGWRMLLDDDKIVQCAHQWKTVNEKLWRERDHLDRLVSYHELCARPVEMVRDILEITAGAALDLQTGFPPIRYFDDEYAHGSRLRSKNRYYRETGSLETPKQEAIEFPPLSKADVARIEEICRSVAGQLGLDE